MGRTSVRALLAAGLLVTSLAMAAEVRAAGHVVVAVSPTEVDVGEPVGVLVRTFLVVDRRDLSLPFESPIAPYPVPSGVWDVLYPWADYPFDVVAQHAGDADVAVELIRDPSDSTLWRGTVTLPSPGTWTIWIRNFPGREPGSTATVTVRRAGEAGPIALIVVAAGLVAGILVAFGWRRRRTFLVTPGSL